MKDHLNDIHIDPLQNEQLLESKFGPMKPSNAEIREYDQRNFEDKIPEIIVNRSYNKLHCKRKGSSCKNINSMNENKVKAEL